MNVFLIFVRDEIHCHVLPMNQNGASPDADRVRVMGFPPLGIQVLAPVLRQQGHQVRLFDTCHPRMKAKDIIQEARTERPGVIALSMLSTTAYPVARDLARHIKEQFPNIPIIAGGPFASVNADHILKDCHWIDSVGVGEGEELLPDYLDHIADPGSVAGLVWRKGGDNVHNEPRPLIQDLDQFPYPDRISLPIDYIESLPLDVPAVLSMDKFCTMQTSRGCPYTCIYCNIPSLSKGKWRSRSADHVLGEMQQLNDLGYRSIYLTDDHFLLSRKRIIDICTGIIDRKLEFRWGCEGRVDSGAIDQLPLMSKANCGFLAFGVEAGTQKVLDNLKKNQSPSQVEYAVSEAKRHGIGRVHGFFLIGSPDETKKDILDSFRFAARLKLDTFGFNRLCVYRGTPLWKEYVERGIITDDRDWYKWFRCSDIDPTTLSSATVNRQRMKGYALLFAHRVLLRPIQTFRLLRSFSRYMKGSDVLKLLFSPFRSKQSSRKPEFPVRMIEKGLEGPNRPSIPATSTGNFMSDGGDMVSHE